MASRQTSQGTRTVKGIQYLIDENGNKKAVVIDLKKHGDLWEDLYDRLVAEQRRHEPRESLKKVKQRLRRRKKLGGNA